MANIQVRLKDGSLQSMSYPDDWTEEQIKSAIYKNFPYEKSPEQKAPQWQDIFAESLKQKEPSIGARPEVAEARKTGVGQALELPLFFAAPELEVPMLGGILGKLLPNAGKYLTKAIQSSLPQMGLAAGSAALSGQSPLKAASETGEITAPLSLFSQALSAGSPTLRNIGRLGLLGAGAGLGYLGGEKVGGGYGGLVGSLMGAAAGGHGLLPSSRAQSKVFGHGELGDINMLKEKVNAAKRLGLSHLTPAEASGSEYAGALEGTLKRLPGSGQTIREAKANRLGSEQKSIQNVIDTVFPEELGAQRTKLYEEAKSKSIPPSWLEKWRKNKIFEDAEKQMLNDTAYQEKLSTVAPNSVEYLDLVKRKMDKMARVVGKEDKFGAELINDTKNDLLKDLDKYSIPYEEARGLGQRGILQRKLSEFFNNREMTGSNFYKFLKNKKNYNELQKNLSSLEGKAPNEARKTEIKKLQKSLEDMKFVFKDLIGGQTARSASKLSETSMKDTRNALDALKTELKKVFPALSSDKAVADLITHPEWIKQYEKYQNMSKNWERAGSGVDLFAKALARKETQNE